MGEQIVGNACPDCGLLESMCGCELERRRMSDVNYIAEVKPNPGNEKDAQCSICGAVLVCLSCGNHRDAPSRMSKIQRWKFGHAWNGTGTMTTEPDGEYVLFTDHIERVQELEEALRGLLDLGRKDTSNPKYDGYYDKARAALRK